MSNYSIFEQNVLLAIDGSGSDQSDIIEEAKGIFLRFKDRNRLLAERAAYEWCEFLAPFFNHVLPIAANQHPSDFNRFKTVSDVKEFLKERHVRQYFPGHKVDI